MSTPNASGRFPASPRAYRTAKLISAHADLAVTGALCTLVVVAATGFARVYSGASWAPPVIASIVAASVATLVARRAGLRYTTGAISGLLAIWVASCDIVLSKSTHDGLPLLGTLRAVSRASSQAAASFMAAGAPAHALPGFVLWSAWGTGAAVIVADWLALRQQSLAAVVPPLLVFVTACILGAPAGRTWAVATFVAATVLFVLVHQWALGDSRAPAKVRTFGTPSSAYRSPGDPVTGHPNIRRPRHLIATGTSFIAIAVVAGVVVVPALGNDGSGIAGWRQLFNTTARVTPDPLVSIQSELLQGSRRRVFVVQSTTPGYWRLTSFQHFDGTNWTASGTYLDVHDRLSGTKLLAGHRRVVETFDIQQLGSPWLPVAFQPVSVSSSAAASYDPISGSLLSRHLTADGERYQVVADEDLSADNPVLLSRIRAITAKDRSGLAQFLQLPPGIPASVVELSHRLAPRGDSEYQKALSLKYFFRQQPFVYTLAAPAGSGTNDLVAFLFHTHAGYCQQYALAYAVLARLAGLPARVAVGFTTGTAIGRDKWQVYGADAHAWPEVWFPTVGWVAFEPTPTFVIPSTHFAGQPGKGTSNAGVLVNTVHFGYTRSSMASSPLLAPGVAKAAALFGGLPIGANASAHRWYDKGLLLIVLLVVGSVTSWVVLVRAGELWRWRRRRLRLIPRNFLSAFAFLPRKKRRAVASRLSEGALRDPVVAFGWLVLAWEELSEHLGLSGLLRRASETPTEFVCRAGEALRNRGTLSCRQEDVLVEIGESFSRAAYSDWRPAVAQLLRLRGSAHQIGRRARAGLGWRRRLVHYLDPRTTWRPVPMRSDLTLGASRRMARRRPLNQR
jgi:transglutaminase-like putative cysteine protease